MKEKSFKFKESFFTAISNLNEKQAGRLLKGVCEYAFNGKEFVSKDAALNSSFAFIKTAIDEEAQTEERNEYGGIVTISKKHADESSTVITADLGKQKCSLYDFLGCAMISVNTDYNAKHKTNKSEGV